MFVQALSVTFSEERMLGTSLETKSRSFCGKYLKSMVGISPEKKSFK